MRAPRLAAPRLAAVNGRVLASPPEGRGDEVGGAMVDRRETIGFDDFLRLDIRVGTVVKAEPYPEARQPAYKVWVDFGAEFGVKKTSAQATAHYTVGDLIGRQVAAVVNFPPKQIGKFMSEILVLGFPDASGEVVLVVPERRVPDGGRMY